MHNSIFSLFFFIVLSAIEVFVLIAGYSYDRQLVDETASTSILGVVHYAYENLKEDKTVLNPVDSTKLDATANNGAEELSLKTECFY